MSMHYNPMDPTSSPYPQVSEGHSYGDIKYAERAKKFSIIAACFALLTSFFPLLFESSDIPFIGSLHLLFPISFAFSYISYRSAAQARQQGNTTGYSKYVAIIPLLLTIIGIIYLGVLLANDESGWGGLVALVVTFYMIPGIIASLLTAYFLKRYFTKKDNANSTGSPSREPSGMMISTFRIIGVLSLIPILYVIYIFVTIRTMT